MSYLQADWHLVRLAGVFGPHSPNDMGTAMRPFAYTLSFARKALGRPAIRSMITSFNRSACHG